jgi:ribosomal protein S27AE
MRSIPSSSSIATHRFERPKQERVLTVRLQCHLCGQTCGVLEAPESRGLPPVVRFTGVDGGFSRPIAWQRLRCPRCGSGSLFADELEIVTRRHEGPIDMDLDRPRRGRPPRWLLELRARREAA